MKIKIGYKKYFYPFNSLKETPENWESFRYVNWLGFKLGIILEIK